MKCVKLILIISFSIFLIQPIVAQNKEDSKKGDRYRFCLKNGSHLEVKNGIISDNLLMVTYPNGEHADYPLSEILSMEKRTGNRAAFGLAAGAGVGLLTASLAYMQASVDASSDPYKEINDDAVGPVFAILTGVGAITGLIYGSTMDKWEKVSLSSSLSFAPKLDRKMVFLTLNF
ncbi:MAG: hypothetical protein KAR42_05630 [candidate division Zixibacteria bacterium]|nr:hypothetical protein [candidate division Zixibacteria bacterium]